MSTPTTTSPCISSVPSTLPCRETTRRAADIAVGQQAAPVGSTDYHLAHRAHGVRHQPGKRREPRPRPRPGAPGPADIALRTSAASTALATRHATDWAGPDALVERSELGFGEPYFPGDIVTFSGQVTGMQQLASGAVRLDLSIEATNERGPHLTGTINVTLPPASEGLR